MSDFNPARRAVELYDAFMRQLRSDQLTEAQKEVAKSRLREYDGLPPAAQYDFVFMLCNGYEQGRTVVVADTSLFHIVRHGFKVILKKEYAAMYRVLRLKWQIFGLKKYMEQLAMYGLLLLTMSLSISMDIGHDSTTTLHTQICAWLSVGMALVVVLVGSRLFVYDHKVKWIVATLAIIAALGTGLYTVYPAIFARIDGPTFATANNIVLGLAALYFFIFEVNELTGEVAGDFHMAHANQAWYKRVLTWCVSIVPEIVRGPLGCGHSVYFQSVLNRVQMPTFGFLLVYVVMEFCAPLSPTIRAYLGIPVTLLLWLLGLQYLEVHPTAGVLLPMMQILLADIGKFFLFYAPFQCGYTVAYYLLFQGHDQPAYKTLGHSFTTTFLVMLGQINLEPFEDLKETYVLGYALLLTHATIVIVVLLNVLIAILNKSVDMLWDKADSQAQLSFAECILRSEITGHLETVSLNQISSTEQENARTGEETPLIRVV